MALRIPVVAALVLITLLGYLQFPGHTYLQSDTQIYVPILEHLRDAHVFANDIVATKPHVSYTVYDEVSLLLRGATGLDFQWVLEAQQFFFRFLGITGVLLIATSVGLTTRMALLAAAIIQLGATIGGPAVLTLEYEPVPRGFAVQLIIFSLGLFAHQRYRLAGIVAGVAVLYHPPTVLPLLATIAVMLIWPSEDRTSRLAALWPLAVAIPLLLILSRFQAGVSEKQVFFEHIDPALEAMQRYRAMYNWISMWPTFWFRQHVYLCLVSLAAVWRLRAVMNEQLRICFTVMPLYGLLSVPASYIVLDLWKWSIMPQLQPARAVLFVTLCATVGAAVAGIRAAQRRAFWEATLWFVVAYAVPANVRLEPDFADPLLARRALLVLALTALATFAAWMEQRRGSVAAWVAAIVLPFFLTPDFGKIQNFPVLHTLELDDLSGWARAHTPQDSVFLFPDAGHGLQPGVFRVRALRAVYVDWKSGGQVNLLKHFAEEWWRRWHAVIPTSYQAPDFPLYAKLQIDYIVLKTEHRLPDRQPEFQNAAYAVYRVPAGT